MKRSEINSLLKRTAQFCESMNSHLPPFAFWSPEEWAAAGDDMILRDHPILYVHAPTHNTWNVGDHSSGRRKAVETTIDVAYALAEKHGLELVPASLADMHEEADRLNAY